MFRKGIAAFILLFAYAFAPAQEPVNEDDLFGDPSAMIEERLWPDAVKNGDPLKTVNLSGEITSAFVDSGVRVSSSSQLTTYMLGNLFLDIRLQKGLKALANVEACYVASDQTTLVNIREFFFDFNVNHKAYFRTGKQVLQWGRCYFWNPTDLLNVEGKSFIQKIGYREGAFGVKLHVPFGTRYNIYGFIDTGNVSESRDTAAAGKFEFLVGNTEMALAAWGKRGYVPVWGYDVSTRLFGIDTLGEISVSQGDIRYRMKEDQGILSLYRSDDWTSRACVSLGRNFDYGEIKDRISVNGEFYYNQSGYDGDAFSGDTIYRFAQPVIVPAPGNGGIATVTEGTRRDFISHHTLYETHSFSKYYAALFTGVRRFIVTDMTLNLNYIRNLCDGSGILSTGVQYKDINDFSYSVLLSTYLGPNGREYTYSGALYTLQAAFGISF